MIDDFGRFYLPTLYHLGKNGVVYSWNIWVVGPQIHSDTGQVDGARIHSVKVAVPKNVGRANATTAEQQAIAEAKAMHTHKLTRRYSLDAAGARAEEKAPMLCGKFPERKDKNVVYPVDVQPKLNGCRALAYWDGDHVVLTSRGAKAWTVPTHINEDLERFLPKDTVLDGELYVHGVSLQTLNSWMKKLRPETMQLEYHVYDIPEWQGEDSAPWSVRRENLKAFGAMVPADSKVCVVQTHEVTSEAEVESICKTFVNNKYEGGIIRNHAAFYTYGYRSNDVLKLKPFFDAEYKVIGFTNGVGKMANCVIWICEGPNGQTFNVTPKGTQAEREAFLTNAPSYIGQLLTVQFNDFYDDGLPQFPVGLGFRLPEDLPGDAKV